MLREHPRTVVDNFRPSLSNVVDLDAHIRVALSQNGNEKREHRNACGKLTLPPSVASTFLNTNP